MNSPQEPAVAGAPVRRFKVPGCRTSPKPSRTLVGGFVAAEARLLQDTETIQP